MSNVTKVIAYIDLDDDATYGGQYGMNVSLAARLDDGREIAGDGFGFAGPRSGLGAIWHRYRGPQLHEDPVEHDRLLEASYHVGMDDVQDAVNQMLGRDPEMHRPPRLSWERLQRALDDQGIRVSEQRLIDTPLELVLSASAAAEVNAEPPSPRLPGSASHRPNQEPEGRDRLGDEPGAKRAPVTAATGARSCFGSVFLSRP